MGSRLLSLRLSIEDGTEVSMAKGDCLTYGLVMGRGLKVEFGVGSRKY